MKKDENGFALITLIVVIALSAIIATGAGMTTVQVIKVTQATQDQSIAVRQAQNLGFWVSQELMKAYAVTTTDDPDTTSIEFIIIRWKDWQTGDIYDTRYYWYDPESTLKKVFRKNVVHNNSGGEISNTLTLVADNIYSANLSLEEDIRWKLSIEARSGNKSETREYEIGKRLY
jgi:type II secretory pathway pseudopilin PulG